MKRKVVKIILVLLMIISLINIFIWFYENNKTKEITTKAKKYINIDNNIISPKIKNINEDIIGWLIVDNTNINYPVVQGKNNEFYLNHDLDKEYNSAGWIFMDSNNNLDDQNIIIYGHHRRDGSMFGSIDNLLNKNKRKKKNLIKKNKKNIYNIFSIYKTEKNYNYREKNYSDLYKKTAEFKKRSIINYNIDITSKNQIITLSTCDNDNKNRIVIHGIKIE